MSTRVSAASGQYRVVVLVPVLAWVAAIIAAAIVIARGPRPVTLPFAADRLLRYIFFFPVGLMGLWAALGHLFFPAMVARTIGWQASPFQFEVGAAQSRHRSRRTLCGVSLLRGAARDGSRSCVFPGRGRDRSCPRHHRGRQSRAGQCRTDLVHRPADTVGNCCVALAQSVSRRRNASRAAP
jgi:hypothetical protein